MADPPTGPAASRGPEDWTPFYPEMAATGKFRAALDYTSRKKKSPPIGFVLGCNATLSRLAGNPASAFSTLTVPPGFSFLMPNATPRLSVFSPERVTVPNDWAAISLPRNAQWNGFVGSAVGTAVVLK